jgi:hypothetical protein
LETTNNGKPLCDARGDIQECADVFRYYSGLALTVGKREVIKVCDDNFETVVTKVPIGVVALITPFNYPLLMATWKVRNLSKFLLFFFIFIYLPPPPSIGRSCAGCWVHGGAQA